MRCVGILIWIGLLGCYSNAMATPYPWVELLSGEKQRENTQLGESLSVQELRKNLTKQVKQDDNNNADNIATLMPHILNEKELIVTIYPPSQYTQPVKHALIQRIVQHAFSAWFENAIAYVEQAGRREEFADVLTILRRGVSLKFEEYLLHSLGNPADLSVAVWENLEEVREKCKCKDCVACRFEGGRGLSMLIHVYENSEMIFTLQ